MYTSALVAHYMAILFLEVCEPPMKATGREELLKVVYYKVRS